MTGDTERAWAAGFFDGEGSVARTTTKNGRCGVPLVTITQAGTDGVPDTLTRFAAAIGVPVYIYGPVLIDGRKDRYQLNINRYEHVIAARDTLWPYLSSEKRKAFERRLAEYEEKRANPLPRSVPWTHCKNGHPLTSDNVYLSGKTRTGRRCKTCQKAATARQRERRRQTRHASTS